MRSWTPYVWKELCENRRLGLVSLGVFLAISFIPSIIETYVRPQVNWYNGNALAVLFLCGPLLAVVAGVYAMGREHGAVESFWRSRPVRLNHWLVSKYVMGLALVWLTCWTPLLIQGWGRMLDGTFDQTFEGLHMALAYSFILLLIYSASFMLGQCIRGVLHAVILGVAAMALIFIMPLVIAPLNWLSLEVMDRVDVGTMDLPSYVAFAAGMTGLSIVLLCLSGVLLKRGIQIDADQRTLSWSVVVILLVLAAGVAFPMGTNLSPEQVISLPVGQAGWVHDLRADGNDVLVLLSSGPTWRDSRFGLVRVHVSKQTSVVNEPLWFMRPEQEPNVFQGASGIAWTAERPSLAYTIVSRTALRRDTTGATVEERTYALYTIDLDVKQSDPVVHRAELGSLGDTRWPTICLRQGYLYVYGSREDAMLLTFSLADPKAPSLVGSQDLAQRIGWPFEDSPEQDQIRLAPILDVNGWARIEVTHELAPRLWAPAGNGRVLGFALESGTRAMRLVLFETGPTEDSVVPLRPVAHYRVTAIERLLGFSYGGEFVASDHLACRLSSFGATIYDVHDSKRIKRIGHYAAGDGSFNVAAALPNDRVVVAGRKLHVLDLSNKASAK